jgi:DNA-binding transcriptional ArsR family regulator
MGSIADFAATAALMGDPVRAQMLGSLMDGRALTASELASGAGVTPQTASGHLIKLADGGLIALTRQGRYHYYRIASPAVAQAIEHLWSLSGEGNVHGRGGISPGRSV